MQRIPAIKDDEAECVAFAPDGCPFVFAPRTGPNELWDSASGITRRFGSQHDLYAGFGRGFCSFSPDGRFIVVGGPHKQPTQLWNATGTKLIRTVGKEEAFSPSRLFPRWKNPCHRGDRHIPVGGGYRQGAGTAQGRFLASGQGSCLFAGRPNAGLGTPMRGHLALGSRDRPGALPLCRQLENAHRLPALAFSPDGQTLATGNDWTTILLWDVTGRSRSGQPATGKQPARDLTATWEDLASPDASSAYEAIGRLVRAPNQTIPFLRGRFRPIPRPDLKRQARARSGSRR